MELSIGVLLGFIPPDPLLRLHIELGHEGLTDLCRGVTAVGGLEELGQMDHFRLGHLNLIVLDDTIHQQLFALGNCDCRGLENQA